MKFKPKWQNKPTAKCEVEVTETLFWENTPIESKPDTHSKHSISYKLIYLLNSKQVRAKMKLGHIYDKMYISSNSELYRHTRSVLNLRPGIRNSNFQILSKVLQLPLSVWQIGALQSPALDRIPHWGIAKSANLRLNLL